MKYPLKTILTHHKRNINQNKYQSNLLKVKLSDSLLKSDWITKTIDILIKQVISSKEL